MLKRALLAALLLATAAEAAPQTYSLVIAPDGGLGGNGAPLIEERLAHAQFILYGEDHGFADSPLVLRAIAHDARPYGFRYHVVEVGPLSTRMIRDTLARDGEDGLHRLVHEVPLGIPFLSLKDDAALASDFLGHDAKGTPYLWGVDQEFIGSPVFHLKRLVATAPDDRARAAASKLLGEEQDAAAKAAQQDFLLSRFKDADFDALAAAFKGSSEGRNIIAEMKESAAIYQLWMSGRNYENNARRARLLAKNFLSDYRAAADARPKIVFKMGLEHVALGTTTVNTVDLGTLATEMARADGMDALRIAFLPAGGRNIAFAPKPGNPTTVEAYDSPETKELFKALGVDAAALPKDGWTLIPMEGVRQSLDTAGIEKLAPFARFVVLGYDYVITTPDAKPGVSLY
ncbi:MAG: hypothetical protein JOZ72_09085 [Alphaproteobacteria bacterium]|nr:hypothetical protein [Alphaproteobacteria bacterium]